MRKALRLLALVAFLDLSFEQAARADWPEAFWNISRPGLVDSEHTGSNQAQQSMVSSVASFGWVTGTSVRYSGTSERGHSTWVWSPEMGTVRLGLSGAEYADTQGRREGSATASEAGFAYGTSARYSSSGISLGQAAWGWRPEIGVQRMGLVDGAHTNSVGTQLSLARGAVGSDRLYGLSYRYLGFSQSGQSAWVWAPATGTTRIGLFDGEHTSPAGIQSTELFSSGDNAGVLVGSSVNYHGSATGRSVWTWTPQLGTVRMGLVDALHTRSDGLRSSTLGLSNDFSTYFGTSVRYAGLSEFGQTAWRQYAGSAPTRIGFTDGEHTRIDGFQSSSISTYVGANAIGSSQRFSGSSSRGTTAWFWRPDGTSARLGLVDAQHTSADGSRSSMAFGVAPDAWVIGVSDRYNAGSTAGRSAWVWREGAATERLGLTGAENTRSDGLQNSAPDFISPVAHLVSGRSTRYVGMNELGTSQWAWSPTTGTQRIGLTSEEFTRSDGRQDSTVFVTNDAQIAGVSSRYAGASSSTTTGAWSWSPQHGTVRIGLFDAEHTLPDGSQDTSIAKWAGRYVAGVSTRYEGEFTVSSRTTWVYDCVLDRTYSVANYAYPRYLTEDGVLIGEYGPENRLFAWSAQNGFADVASLVRGGVSQLGFSSLNTVSQLSRYPTLVGTGSLGNLGSTAFVLVVPSPAASFFAVGLLATSLRRRRP